MTPFDIWSRLPRTEWEHYPTWNRLQLKRYYELVHQHPPIPIGILDTTDVMRRFFAEPFVMRSYMEWLEREFLNPIPVRRCAHCDQPLHDPEQESEYCSSDCAGLARLDLYGDEEC